MNRYVKTMLGLVLAFAIFLGLIGSAVAIPRLQWFDHHEVETYVVNIHK